MYRHAKKWTSIVSESLEEVLKDVRYRLLTQFPAEEVDEIMEEWDMSFVEHNAEVWSKTQEARDAWRKIGLKAIERRMKLYGYPPGWTDWETAMEFIHKGEEK